MSSIGTCGLGCGMGSSLGRRVSGLPMARTPHAEAVRRTWKPHTVDGSLALARGNSSHYSKAQLCAVSFVSAYSITCAERRLLPGNLAIAHFQLPRAGVGLVAQIENPRYALARRDGKGLPGRSARALMLCAHVKGVDNCSWSRGAGGSGRRRRPAQLTSRANRSSKQRLRQQPSAHRRRHATVGA